ncbi:hypothetical protein KDC22_13005 [Paenibacillus tritici]|uniref:hypothetical protein n=1 Tax=Paenibacillus tritici TaxID=1873425 RepID=UPI001BA8BAA8|nr:hypothetical protein [Paenibacillus tritici]QUL57300.1 hypothetical protein KDC22_13005 [Paenibacillus tritici]
MNQVKGRNRYRVRAAGTLILAAAVVLVFSLSGCSRPGGNDDTSGAEASAMPSPAVTQPPSPAAGQTDAPEGTEPAASAPDSSPSVLTAFMDPDKLQPVFGFADETGSHILVTREEEGNEQQMQSLNTAIGNGGQELAVKFEKWQAGSEDSNGRELANNIPHLSGYLFKVEGGSAEQNETYYLADSAQFPQAALLAIQPADPAAPQLAPEDPVRQSIAAVKQRKIESVWKLADLGPDRRLYVVQFVRMDKDMLFSLVLEEDGKLSFKDYPAVLQDNEYSVWRVDDGGEVIPQMFSLLFAAQAADGLLIGLNWWGAEGVSSFFLSQEGGGFTELKIEYSRYISPL